jgi:tetratricopeptide (TPR) repeat protein
MQPGDWKPGYYLGLIYWGKSRYEDVQAEFGACGDKPDYAAFYVSRGFLQKGTNDQKAVADYERALALDKKDWRTWHQTIGLYNERSMFDKALALFPASKAALSPGERDYG